MFFWQHDDGYSHSKRNKPHVRPIADYYSTYIAGMIDPRHGVQAKPARIFEYIGEWKWWEAGRPYYNLWPAISDTLLDFKRANVPNESYAGAIEKSVAVQFPKDHPTRLRSLLVSVLEKDEIRQWIVRAIRHFDRMVGPRPVSERTEAYLPSAMEWVEKDLWEDGAICITRSFESGQKQNAACRLHYVDHAETLGCDREFNLASALLLMEQDPDIVTVDVLKRHEQEYAKATPERRLELEQAATKVRGQRGWDIGKDIERDAMSPHWRRPHPARVWHGPGRKLAKVVIRKGSVVHRHKLTEVPTGFHGELLQTGT